MVSIRPFKPEVAAVLALSWAIPCPACPAAFIAPESHPLCHSKARPVVPVPHPVWSVRSRETEALVRSQRPRGADDKVDGKQGATERLAESPLPPLSLAPDDIHDSILEAYVQPHLKSKSYEPSRPPLQPPQAPSVNGSVKEVQVAPRPVKAGAESQERSGGSWWGREWWTAIVGGRNGTSNAQEDRGKVGANWIEEAVQGEAEGAARRRARRRGLHKNGHDVKEGVRQLLRYKKKKDAQASGEGAKKPVRVATKGRPPSTSFSPPSSKLRSPPAKPRGPFSPPSSWSSFTARALRRVVESPSVTWLANRLPRSTKLPSPPPKDPPRSSPLSPAPLLQRIMDPRSSPIFMQARSGFGRELRPDDLLKLPRNVEEAWDTIMDDTRHFFDSLYKALVPDTSRVEAPPTRPRVGLERPKAQRRRSGGLNAVPMALRESMSRQAAAKWAVIAGKDPLYDDDDEEEESGEMIEEGEDEEDKGGDWVVKVQRSLGATPSQGGQRDEAGEEQGEEQGEGEGQKAGGDKGFVMRYPLALPTPPLTMPRPEVDITAEARNPAPFPRVPTPSPPPAPPLPANPVRRAAQIERNSAQAIGEEQEDEEKDSRPRPSGRIKSPFVVPKGPKPKSWLDNVLQRIFASPDRALETARRRMLIRRVPRRMDERFLRTVSRKLQGDRLRIREFQLQTDRFRNSLLSAEAYYDAVAALFGSSDSADEVLLPLIDTLPEQSKRRGLAEVYKARRQGQWGGAMSQASREPVRPEDVAPDVVDPGDEQEEPEQQGGGGGFRAAVAGTVGNWWSATAGFARNAWAALANRTLEITLEREGAGDGEGTEEEEEEEPYEPFRRSREMLGERNVEFLRMRLDTFRRGGITAADFYRSLQRLGGPMPRVDAVMEEVGLELVDSARQWELLRAVHEGQKRSLVAGEGI